MQPVLRWLRQLLLATLPFVLAIPAAWAQSLAVYSSGSLEKGSTRQLSAYVPLTNPAVVWSVNGVPGGNASIGTVSSTGLYTAPAVVPSPNAVTVKITSVADPTKTAAVTLTITERVVHLWSSYPSSVPVGSYSVSLNGVNFSAASVASVNGQAVASTLVSGTSLRITGVAPADWAGKSVPVKVVNTGLGGTTSETVNLAFTTATSGSGGGTTTPPPSGGGTTTGPVSPGTGLGTPNLKAARLLEQAAFGPTPGAIQQVNSLGVNGWIDAQLSMPETAIPNPGGMNVSAVRQGQMARMSSAPDQLRQRAIFALSQIVTVSFNKNIYPDQMVPYLQLLSRNAFGNYRTLLGELTLSTPMGKYLDMANSARPGVAGGANENYARELMQLFTIGLVALNEDGSPKLDSQGRPIPTYDQATLQQVALALTGWTYPGPNATGQNWENFSGPMVARPLLHDPGPKTFLGCSLPAGRTPQQDVDATLDCVFNHPNTPPFISLRLIRNLVTSNPSPAYVQRVTAVFKNNGSGVRGDLRAVLRAILTDAEARNDSPGAAFGRLKDPLPHAIAVLRAVGGSMSPSSGLSYLFGQMGQSPLTPNTVFGYYAALYRIPGTSTAGPEFQIYSPGESVMRHNLMYHLLTQPGGDFTADWSPFVAVAGDIPALIDKVDQTFLYGRMPQAMRQSLATAIAAQPDNNARAQVALLLTLASGPYAVQH